MAPDRRASQVAKARSWPPLSGTHPVPLRNAFTARYLPTLLRLKDTETATNREIHMPDFEKRPVILPILVLLAFVLTALPAGAQTLKAVKERGTLNCGVSQGLLGFSSTDDRNAWTGFDVDIAAPWRRRYSAIPPR